MYLYSYDAFLWLKFKKVFKNRYTQEWLIFFCLRLSEVAPERYKTHYFSCNIMREVSTQDNVSPICLLHNFLQVNTEKVLKLALQCKVTYLFQVTFRLLLVFFQILFYIQGNGTFVKLSSLSQAKTEAAICRFGENRCFPFFESSRPEVFCK